ASNRNWAKAAVFGWTSRGRGRATMKTLLLAEDNDDDVLITKIACQSTGIPHDFHVVRDGDEAIDYLAGSGKFADRKQHPLPHLVFLDIRMPKRNGHEVLEWIRSQEQFCKLPVVMLTVSNHHEDVARAYSLGVTSYMRKMASQVEFEGAVKVILK